jgi:hypothetical protein
MEKSYIKYQIGNWEELQLILKYFQNKGYYYNRSDIDESTCKYWNWLLQLWLLWPSDKSIIPNLWGEEDLKAGGYKEIVLQKPIKVWIPLFIDRGYIYTEKEFLAIWAGYYLKKELDSFEITFKQIDVKKTFKDLSFYILEKYNINISLNKENKKFNLIIFNELKNKELLNKNNLTKLKLIELLQDTIIKDYLSNYKYKPIK